MRLRLHLLSSAVNGAISASAFHEYLKTHVKQSLTCKRIEKMKKNVLTIFLQLVSPDFRDHFMNPNAQASHFTLSLWLVYRYAIDVSSDYIIAPWSLACPASFLLPPGGHSEMPHVPINKAHIDSDLTNPQRLSGVLFSERGTDILPFTPSFLWESTGVDVCKARNSALHYASWLFIKKEV